MKILRTLKNISTIWLADVPQFYCLTCGEKTIHYYAKASPTKDVNIVVITPIPIPIGPLFKKTSSEFEVFCICKKCDTINKVANETEKKDILIKYEEQDSRSNPYRGVGDLYIWSEVGRPETCDVCYFENSGEGELNAPTLVMASKSTIIYLCDKHLGWAGMEQTTPDEFYKKIEQWLNSGLAVSPPPKRSH